MLKLFSLALITFFAISCSKAPTPTAEPIRPVKTLKVVAQERQSDLQLAGEVRARYESPMAFRVGGKVTERLVNLGDSVKRGQPIAQIEATDFTLSTESKDAAVAEGRVAVELAETEFRRYESLKKKGAISDFDLDQKRAKVGSERARLKAAESVLAETARQIGYTELNADVDGVITRLDFNVGQVVAPGQVV